MATHLPPSSFINRHIKKHTLYQNKQDIAVLQDHAAAADDEFGSTHDLPPGGVQFLQNWTVDEALKCVFFVGVVVSYMYVYKFPLMWIGMWACGDCARPLAPLHTHYSFHTSTTGPCSTTCCWGWSWGCTPRGRLTRCCGTSTASSPYGGCGRGRGGFYLVLCISIFIFSCGTATASSPYGGWGRWDIDINSDEMHTFVRICVYIDFYICATVHIYACHSLSRPPPNTHQPHHNAQTKPDTHTQAAGAAVDGVQAGGACGGRGLHRARGGDESQEGGGGGGRGQGRGWGEEEGGWWWGEAGWWWAWGGGGRGGVCAPAAGAARGRRAAGGGAGGWACGWGFD